VSLHLPKRALDHPLSQPQSIALRIQKKNGVAATKPDSCPMQRRRCRFATRPPLAALRFVTNSKWEPR
jgi:hypothetical protein